MVVERDRPVEVGQWDSQGSGCFPDRVIGQVSVALLKSVQEWQQGSRLAAPVLD